MCVCPKYLYDTCDQVPTKNEIDKCAGYKNNKKTKLRRISTSPCMQILSFFLSVSIFSHNYQRSLLNQLICKHE